MFLMVFWWCLLPKTLLPKTQRDGKMYKKTLKNQVARFRVETVSSIFSHVLTVERSLYQRFSTWTMMKNWSSISVCKASDGSRKRHPLCLKMGLICLIWRHQGNGGSMWHVSYRSHAYLCTQHSPEKTHKISLFQKRKIRKPHTQLDEETFRMTHLPTQSGDS